MDERDAGIMETIEGELARAVWNLPDSVAEPMLAALEAGSFRIGSGVYESELAVCPLVATAKTLGIWIKGSPVAGGPAWGTEDGTSTEVEDFIGWFDLCAEEEGLDIAVQVVRSALTAATVGATAC